MQEQTLGKRVAQLRRDQYMTQRELAECLGLPEETILLWEQDAALPGEELLPQLAALLQISPEELGAPPASPKPEPDPPTAPCSRASRASAPPSGLLDVLLAAVALGTGVATAVLAALQELAPSAALPLLGVGQACLALCLLLRRNR